VASVLLGPVLSDTAASVAGSAAAEGLRTLHCPPCERIHCTPRRALRLQCRGGVTTGICGCCPVCARTAGESCGGRWDYLGKCDAGLLCVNREPSDDMEQGGVCREGKGRVLLLHLYVSGIGIYVKILLFLWSSLFRQHCPLT